MHLDYEFKTVKYIQIAEANDTNEPIDVFDLISRNLPMVGFTKIEDLKKQFEISLTDEKKNEQENFIQVHLKVKPNSVYKDDYTHIECRIDKKINLPAKIKKQAKKTYVRFTNNPYTPSLHFKRIHSTRPIFSVRIIKKYRSIGILKDNEIIWFWIGSHADYDSLIEQLRNQ